MPRYNSLIRALLVTTLCLLSRWSPAAELKAIPTSYGPIVGRAEDGVASFKGIPYAAPPVGELRWLYTQPPTPWTEPRECLKFSPVCPQPTVPLYGDLGPASEDCLYLNVWTCAKVTDEGQIADEKRPVLFWIHGGGFGIGAASQSWYDGTHLAKDGAVVVSINYRLGALGFLAHPGLTAEAKGLGSGNYGLLDMCAALSWTRVNIAKFGGDPENITLWGESAGGAAVCALMTTDLLPHKDFQRAIIMSTNTIVPLRFRDKPNGDLQSMEELGLEFQKRLGVADGPDVLKEMRAKTPVEIMKAGRPGSAAPGVSTTDNISVDGNVLHQQIVEAFMRRRANPIPLLIGNVADEGSMFERKMKLDTVAKYRDFLTQRYGPKADKAFDIYPAATDADVRPALTDLFTDIFVRSTRMHARLMRGANQPVFVYNFTRKAKPIIDSGWDVYHGSELAFFWGTVDDKTKYTDEDRELSRLIRIYLVAFAKDGNPNAGVAPRAPEWPAFGTDERHLTLDVPISVGWKLRAKTLDRLADGALAKEGQLYP